MNFHPPILSGLAAALAGFLVSRAAPGTLYYARVPTPTSAFELRRISADGTGDTPVPIPLPSAGYPSASRDGLRLLVTSPDPGRPFKISRNVYSFEPQTGLTIPVTQFEDLYRINNQVLTNATGDPTTNRSINAYTIHFPNHKAFSPDGRRVAVMDLPRTGGSTLDVPLQGGTTDQVLGGDRAPVLEVYPATGPNPIGQSVYLGASRTGHNQGGDGVDWHPSRNEVVGAVRSDIPVTGNAGIRSTEGTVLAVFATDGRLDPFVRKLTAPSGHWDAFIDAFNTILVHSEEQDYAPSISPDGQRVAYVRHTIHTDSRLGLNAQPARCSLRIIQYDGTGDHEVLAFAQGVWVNRVTWAPDGSALAFDVCPQLASQGFPLLIGDLSRAEVHVVGTDGSNPHRLVAAPACYPSWTPLTTFTPNPRPGITATRRADTLELQLTGFTPGRTISIELSVDLEQWILAQRFTATAPGTTVRLPLSGGIPAAFYRAAEQ